MKQVVIYHANCIDGFTAAWCCWRRFGAAAEYVPAKHGDPPPDVAGKDVVIVDFSYPRETLIEMYAAAKTLRVLDHHKTAEADLAGLHFCTFDMNFSGAGLAQTEFSNGYLSPLVAYVQDRDLWRFQLAKSKEINAWIGSLEHSFQEWSRADVMLFSAFETCAAHGEALLRAVDRYCHEMAKQARLVEFAGHGRIPVVNAPYINTSELVGYLAESAKFAVGWFQRGDGKYQYSLRSRGDFDVSELAKRFGGGGHRQAAGFTVDERVA
jgi:hypothetical protein